MISGTRRSITTAALCALLVSGQILIVSLPTAATSGSSCSALRAWAAPYQNTIPTLDEVAKFDRGHRLAIFNAVAPDVRAALWQEQLRRFAQRPELSVTQRELLLRAAALATPALYRRDPETANAVEELWTRAEKVFTSREQRRIWFDLGAVVPPRLDSTLSDRFARPFQESAQGDFCECNIAYGWLECASGFCSGGDCEWWVGCGPIGDRVCNGICAP